MQKELKNRLYGMLDLLRGLIEPNEFYYAVYLKYLSETKNLNYLDEKEKTKLIYSLEDDLIKGRLLRYLLKEHVFKNESYIRFNNMLNNFKINELKELLIYGFQDLNKYDYNGTPSSIIKLALKVLDIKTGEDVYDMCSGRGDFLVDAGSKVNANFYGKELNEEEIIVSKIRNSLLQDRYFNIEMSDVIESPFFIKDHERLKFDKIFSNYPFLLKLNYDNFNEAKNLLANEKINFVNAYSRSVSTDWFFNTIIINSLKENGKAVAIMPNGTLYKYTDKAIREKFINGGYIESIISLPERMFDYTSIPVTMIVFNKDINRSSIRMIDASNIFESSRNSNSFSEENLKTIYNMYVNDNKSALCENISYEQIKNKDYILSPANHLSSVLETLKLKNGVEFGSVIKKITRGAQISSRELTELAVKGEDTSKYKYLKISDIQNGLIAKNLLEIKPKDNRLDKYCAKNLSLLISAKGTKIKTAIVESVEDEMLIAGGNFLVIDLDFDKVNPFYIQSFLEGNLGQALLQRIQTGSVIKSINSSALKKMKIPMIDLEKQNKIANRYRAVNDEIIYLKNKVEKLEDELKLVHEENIEED